MTSHLSKVRWALAALAALTVALVIAAFFAVALRPAVPLLDLNTPQGVVQRYLHDIEDGRILDATEYLENSAVTGLCDSYTVDNSLLNLELRNTVITGNRAVVTVSIVEDTGALSSLLGIGSYSETFELKQNAGEWKIILAPWPVMLCTDEEMSGYGS